jgi:hypothetical protein
MCILGLSGRRSREMVEVSQHEDFGRFYLSNEGFVLASAYGELAWSN